MNQAWYLVSAGQQKPVALFADQSMAESFYHEHATDCTITKVDISQCVVQPIVEVVNIHAPVPLGGYSA